jgi:hypothetical protein
MRDVIYDEHGLIVPPLHLYANCNRDGAVIRGVAEALVRG